jgi:hypothetical protein
LNFMQGIKSTRKTRSLSLMRYRKFPGIDFSQILQRKRAAVSDYMRGFASWCCASTRHVFPCLKGGVFRPVPAFICGVYAGNG